MITFSSQPMHEILSTLQHTLQTNDSLTFSILNPDNHEGYAGKSVDIAGQTYIYRSYKAWMDLAELLHCKVKTPQIIDEHFVKLTYIKLNTHSFHTDKKDTEKYGVNSHFSRIQKMEEPAFIYYYLQALSNVNVAKRTDILNLGINRGDEFGIIKNTLDVQSYDNLNLTGIDYSQTAIADAKKNYPEDNTTFYTHDINNLDTLQLEKFDLLISIGTLQSSGINFKPYFMSLVQNYLKDDAAIILGFPNSRWVGGEMIYGAKAPNYAMSEMSILLNDVMFCKKYLQQKKYRVTVTGKHYLFLTATKIGE